MRDSLTTVQRIQLARKENEYIYWPRFKVNAKHLAFRPRTLLYLGGAQYGEQLGREEDIAQQVRCQLTAHRLINLLNQHMRATG